MAENPYLAHSDPVQMPPAANPYLQHSDPVQEGPAAADQLDASTPQPKTPTPGSNIVPNAVRSALTRNPTTMVPLAIARALGIEPKFSDESMRDFFQGATLGGGDELAALIRSASPNETYDQALADERARLKQYHKDNAIIGDLTPANALGSMLPMALFRGKVRPTLAGRSLEASKIGAKVGTVHGFLSGEDDATNRMLNATVGAGTGAILGPLIQVATEGPVNALTSLGRFIGNKGVQMFTNPAERANIVPDRIMMKSIRDAETTPQNVLQTLEQGRNVVSDTPVEVAAQLQKSPLYKSASPDMQNELLVKAVEANRQAASPYLPETISDVVGPPMQRTLRAIKNFGGEGANRADQFLSERQGVNVDFTRQYKNAAPTNQYERLSADLADALQVGTKSKEFETVRRALRGERSKEADDLFNQSWQKQDPFDIRPVVSEVRSMALAEADPAIVSMLQNVGKSLERTVDVKPNAVTSDLKAYQRSKEYIDGLISEAQRAGQNYRVKLLRDIKAKADEAVFTHPVTGSPINSAYKDARDAFANKSALMNAAEEGRNFLKGNSEFTSADFAALSEPEKKMWRYGLWQYITKEKLNKALGPTRDFTLALRDPATIDALRMALPGNGRVGGGVKSQTFNDLFAREMRMSQTANAVKGNSTTTQQALDAAQMGTFARIANAVRTSGVAGAAMSQVESLVQRFFGLNQQTGAVIARQVLSTDPRVQRETLQRLAQKFGNDRLYQFGQMIGPAIQNLNRAATVGVEVSREPR